MPAFGNLSAAFPWGFAVGVAIGYVLGGVNMAVASRVVAYLRRCRAIRRGDV